MLRVGTPDSRGTVEIQDLLFTTIGNTAGAVLVEWNIQASSAGAAGMWGKSKLLNIHFSAIRH
jgi:hypothetical protein